MKFGEKVRLLRNEKKLSQTELGKMCGLSLRTISRHMATKARGMQKNWLPVCLRSLPEVNCPRMIRMP